MKRKKLLVIVLTLLVSLFTVIPMGTAQLRVDASEAYHEVDSSAGIVTTADVKLRTGPAKTFDIISKLKKDQKVTVIGKLGDWYAVYVSSSGNVGAVYAPYIKLEKAKTPVASNKQASTINKSPTTTKVAEKTSTKPTAVVTPKVKDISIEEQALLDSVNKARKEKGLKALEFDAGLVKIARLKATDMKNNNYFSHTSKFYGTPFDMMKKYEIKFSSAGENIAGNKTLDKALKAWLNESGNNIFNEKFTHTGIGIVYSPTYGKLFVQMFIKKT
jgi:uncharacterized protein YkwD